MREEQLKAIVLDTLQEMAPEMDPNAVSPDEDLRRALDIDSFDFLNVIIALHEKLGVEIPEADYGRLKTLSGMLAYLSDRTG
ncbi:MAG: acyl carrier protein [Desulfobacterales bacterium]